MKITIIVASQGKNLELAAKVQEVLQKKGVETSLIDVVALNLPLYTSANEKLHNASELIEPIKSRLEARGLVFIAPEYNGGSPPAFANFLAWVSRSTKEWRDAFNGKPALIGTHSAGGGLNVLASMRLQLSYLGVNVMGRQIHTHLQKQLDEVSLSIVCEQLIKLTKSQEET